ncbi:MAG TPA: 50S ribosomal protein L32 [Porphyromonadaceae bacterium]|jgi:large subunit ribosomal protein L32|uniref:50S ribosomal protein L32 n=1 Tax=Limibacterium fermenti TaxID=3229863 RepID=UPI000E861E4F|nr:50S ribosomal protein L32 [Porphyromonadaceae bacterium]HBK31812.1 50S ribosomal protein L32 [Porphyromonadaceae bacterium]HBL33991.1 50S ribosomal protein L32 [Porphyromonadaceae bacterium]HBX20846.1 50S ribosomal protein L32 [Porphyromonadaceae bacterium]HBX47034.1 50S ribosomal protein L32 [Porphyromonadaceae bacterium]
MAHPKRRQSSARQGKRRTHDKAKVPTLAICPATGEYHVYHRAHWHEGKLYYKGKVVIDSEE